MHPSYEQWCEKHTDIAPMLRRLKSSLPEQYIGFYLSKALNVPIEYGKSFDWLGRMSLDIFIPAYNIAIEYDGCFFHKEKGHYEKKKASLCKKHGIYIVRIREKGLDPISDNYAETITYVYSRGYTNISVPIRDLCQFLKQTTGIEYMIHVDLDRDKKEIIRYIQDKFYVNTMAYHWPEVFEYWDDRIKLTPFDLFTRDYTILRCPHCGNVFEYHGRYFLNRKSLIPCECEYQKINEEFKKAKHKYIEDGTLVSFDDSLNSRRLYDRMKFEVEHNCYDEEHHCMDTEELLMYKKFGIDLGWKEIVFRESD